MSAAAQLAPPLEWIRSDLQQVERLLSEAVAQADEPLRPLLGQALDGGKRLRAALVILAGRMTSAPHAACLGLAAAVEMLHAATLVHDDVLDCSPLRRGRDTLHNSWPASTAVLAGDYLLAQSTCWVAKLGHPRLLQVFSQALCDICSGEIRQTLVTKGRHRDRDEYYRSIEAKSAALFATAMEMPGILAGAAEEKVRALAGYGRDLGLAFQIVDDVLDLTGDESELGKPAGSDLRQGLITLPTLHYLQEAGEDALVREVLAGRHDDRRVAAAIQAIRSSGAVEASLAEGRAHARQAQQALEVFPPSAARQTLHALAEFVVNRRH
jgi:heptaprenyl diphosphate synthase